LTPDVLLRVQAAERTDIRTKHAASDSTAIYNNNNNVRKPIKKQKNEKNVSSVRRSLKPLPSTKIKKKNCSFLSHVNNALVTNDNNKLNSCKEQTFWTL